MTGPSPLPTLHATFVFAVYFTTVIAPENGSFYWAQMTALSAFLLAFSAPLMGRYADSKGLVKQCFIVSSVIAAAVTSALWFIQPSSDFFLLALILSGLSIFFNEAAFLFYNGLLPLIGSKSDYGRLSGLGWGCGYIGAIVALLLVLFILILPDPPIFGSNIGSGLSVRLTMLFTGLWLIIFGLPLFIFGPQPAAQPLAGNFKTQMIKSLKQAGRISGMKRFLLAKMMFTDGLVTLFAFGGIFAAKVFFFNQTEILIFAIGLNVTAGLGAILCGKLTDRIGPSLVMRGSLLSLTALGIIAILAPNKSIFWAAGLALGLFIGPCQSSARV